jgi:hypothetical protein
MIDMTPPPKRGGRPRAVIDAEQVERLAPMLTQEQLADYFGIDPATFRRRVSQDGALKRAYKKGKSRAIAGAAGSLLQLVRQGNLGAICFYLKTQGGWRETTHVRIGNLNELSDAELEQVAQGVLPP